MSIKLGDKRGLVLIDEHVERDGKLVPLEVQRILLSGVQLVALGASVDGELMECKVTADSLTVARPKGDECAKCGKGGAMQAYSVHDELWPMRKDQLLHIWCLEELIGRRVVVADLKECQWCEMLRHVMQ